MENTKLEEGAAKINPRKSKFGQIMFGDLAPGLQPRHRSAREEAELDEDYLTMEDIIRHCRPWSKTWPHPDDHSWCKVRKVPDWAIREFMEARDFC